MKHNSGQVLAEYLVVSMFMAALVWYAITGGTLEDEPPEDDEIPSLIQAINMKQDSFTNHIYENP